jgi:hypothetical protein
LTIGGAKASASWTKSAAVEAYLPAGGPPAALSGNLTNPTKTSSGVLGGQLVATKLNVGILGLPTDLVFVFDKECDVPTALVGSSIDSVIDLADATLSSGTPSGGISFSDLAQALTILNENYDECGNEGCLAFPAPPAEPRDRRPRIFRSDAVRRGLVDPR